MLSGPNGSDPTGATSARFVAGPVDAGDAAWLPVDRLLDDPGAVLRLVEAAGSGRFGSDDVGLVVAQVAREAISVLVGAGVHAWTTRRHVLDLTAANVVLRDGPSGTVVGLRHPTPAVLPADRLAGQAGVEALEEPKLLARFLERVLGDPAPLGAVPPGPPDRVAAVAAVIATVRRTVRTGDRHLWGTAALALASTLTRLSHTIGARADEDRRRLLAARPDLARTVELVTVPDAGADEGPDAVTFAVRRTCCLLLKLPAGHQCGTCSLRDRDACIERMTAWARSSRLAARSLEVTSSS